MSIYVRLVKASKLTAYFYIYKLLCLASNRIVKVENIGNLASLRALDIGHNLIDRLLPEELPSSLLFLTTDGNPFRLMVRRESRPDVLCTHTVLASCSPLDSLHSLAVLRAFSVTA